MEITSDLSENISDVTKSEGTDISKYFKDETFYGLMWVFLGAQHKKRDEGSSLECSINGNRFWFDLFRNTFKELNCAEFSWSVKQVRLDWKYWLGKNSITLVRKIELGKIRNCLIHFSFRNEVTFLISILIHYKRCKISFCCTFEFLDQNWIKVGPKVDQNSRW